MQSAMKIRLEKSIEKNLSDAKALVKGEMPYFIYRNKKRKCDGDEVPVFVFHQVNPDYLEQQFQYITSNGYTVLDADELKEAVCRGRNAERTIAITFDDASWSFWTYAFPLLQKYRLKALLFVSPGLVPDENIEYPGLHDVWEGRRSMDEISRRSERQPLCTWRELRIMHESGYVDIQSHSLTHSRIPVAEKLEDFLHPGFDTGSFGNIKVPLSSLDIPGDPVRKAGWGAPIFTSASRMGPQLRFFEAPELHRTIMTYVQNHGGSDFFTRNTWRNELEAIVSKWPAEKLGRFETTGEMEEAISYELTESKHILETKLREKAIRHFCYPWFVGSDTADRLAGKAGYETVHCGVDTYTGKKKQANLPIRIRRISEEYLFMLPGKGRKSLWYVLRNKLCGSGNRSIRVK